MGATARGTGRAGAAAAATEGTQSVIRALRGATRVDDDEREHVLARTRELVAAFLDANGLGPDDVVSLLISATRDISSVAPAVAARQLGLESTALLCVQEMAVQGSMPRVIRFMAHVDSDRDRSALHNVYLHGTEVLRADIPPVAAGSGRPG